MRISILLFLIGFGYCLNAQFCDSLYAEKIFETNGFRTNILNNGELFVKNGEPYFFHDFQGLDRPSVSNFYKAGIWIGGVDPGGNLKVAATPTERNQQLTDFAPGPLNPETGMPYEEFPCHDFNRIWEISREDILTHIKDFGEDRVLDNPIPSIMNWPGNGNKHLEINSGETIELPNRPSGFAPFWDEDGNGIYNPEKGDFPQVDLGRPLIPDKMFWTVFNDFKEHPVASGLKLRVEVQLTVYSMDCLENQSIDNTLFLNYKVINQGDENIETGKFGFYADFQIGCEEDDYIGSFPQHDAFFAYNSDQLDGDSLGNCIFGNSYGFHPTTQAVSFLYGHKLNAFQYFENNSVIPSISNPTHPQEFYNYLYGRWRNGTPLTTGNNGFNIGSTDTTLWAFSGDPNLENSWSLFNENLSPGNRRVIGSTNLSRWDWLPVLQPGGVAEIRLAVTTIAQSNRTHLTQLDRIKIDFHELDLWYGFGSPNVCSSQWIRNPKAPEDEPSGLKIYPNPAFQNLIIEYPKPVQRVQFFDVSGRLIHEIRNPEETVLNIDVGNWSRGIYFAEITIEGHKVVEKIVLMN